MRQVVLPRYSGEGDLINFVSRCKDWREAVPTVLDLTPCLFWRISSIVSFLASIQHLRGMGTLRYDKSNPHMGYFERMGFFRELRIETDNEPVSSSGPSYVGIREVDSNLSRTKDVASEITKWLLGEGEFSENERRTCEYVLGEIINNTTQHSEANGYVALQKYVINKRSGLREIEICIADSGIGIRESFKETRSPVFREDWSDLDALLKALEPEVSSRTHLPRNVFGNQGIGLSMIRSMVKNCCGKLTVISNGAYFKEKSGIAVSGMFDVIPFQGTIVSIVFNEDHIGDYVETLNVAREYVGSVSKEELDVCDILGL